MWDGDKPATREDIERVRRAADSISSSVSPLWFCMLIILLVLSFAIVPHLSNCHTELKRIADAVSRY